MRRAIASVVLVAACSDYGVTIEPDYTRPTYPGSIAGRVCDPNGTQWLADATVYVNVADENGVIVDVRTAYTDKNGDWLIADLAPDVEYTVYIQHGDEIVDTELVFVANGEDVRLPDPSCFDPLELSIAIVTGDYDDIDTVLESMGFANYRVVDGTSEALLTEFLTDADQLGGYDIVFFNGGHVEEGIFYDYDPTNPTPDQVVSNLRAYVAGGGSVYASDWSYDVIEIGWPDAIDFLGDDNARDAAQLGEYALVDAKVTDEALAEFLGKNEIEIEYDLPVWPPIESVEPYVSVHLTGNVEYRQGELDYQLPSVPLLVSFSGGEGRVGFATFRVVANHTSDTVNVLQYMLGEL